MDWKKDVRDFLVSRRARVTPARAGLPDPGGERRVPGLRREEVAALAGVSTDYYTRLERGNIASASDGVLDAIARALLLDDAERAHLFDLARTRARGSRHSAKQVRPSVRRILDAMDVPAMVQNAAQDVVAANALGRAFYAPHFEAGPRPNIARFVFLDPRAREFYVDWELTRRTCAAMIRRDLGRDPANADLAALVGELSARSATFAQDWARHNVHVHRTGTKAFRHPRAGLVEVDFDVFELPGDDNLIMVTYSAAPGTPAADALALLAMDSPTAADIA
ncbi:helix-turn-helix transcriptional regulator [Amycolatopsis sacchari]|uniref:helix-turn-helix transcriptional regulator n=1 Tax=Amycolatopsis sacchari TaxID=115433 RepID=UPI003D7040F3